MASAAALIGEAVRERAQGLDRCLQAVRTGPFVDARRIEAALSLLPPGFSSALLAGSFSRARLARGAGEGGGERTDPTPDGLGHEDEDAEFERRADGHLGAWAAPTYDADDADDAETLEGLQTRHSAPEEAHTIVLDGRQPCVDMANGAPVSASHQGGAGRQASCPQPERDERSEGDERNERAGAVEQAPGENLTRSTWRERLVRTIGVASCCTAGDVEGEVFGGALASELTRRTSEPETPGRKAAGPEGGLRAGPGGKDQGLEEAPLQQTEAAKRTQEWATLFGQGWAMAAVGTRVYATAADDGPKRSCSQTGDTGHVGARIVETPGAQPTISAAHVTAHVTAHMTEGCASRGAGVRDTQAATIARKPEEKKCSRAGESPGLWAAPLDCGESEEAEDRALGEHEGEHEGPMVEMGGKNQDVTTVWRCKAEEEKEVVDPERDRACDTVHMTPEAGSESRETPAKSCAPVARLQPSLAVGTPKAEGSAVKTMMNRLRNSPGGLLRKSSLQASAQLGTLQGAAPRGPSAVEHVLVEALPPSPAAHITNLVKKAEKDFEKEYGVGTWGASTRRLAHRMGAGDDIESSDEDGDLVV